MKKLCFVLTASAVFLGGCGNDTEPAPTPTRTNISSTIESPSITSATSAYESTKPSTTSEEFQPEPVRPETDAPMAEQVPAEPTVLECLEGTPGPARWSDGTVAYSQWCFDTLGGEEYLEAEHSAGLIAPEQQQPRQPSPWVQGQIDWANCLESGKSEEQCRLELN